MQCADCTLHHIFLNYWLTHKLLLPNGNKKMKRERERGTKIQFTHSCVWMGLYDGNKMLYIIAPLFCFSTVSPGMHVTTLCISIYVYPSRTIKSCFTLYGVHKFMHAFITHPPPLTIFMHAMHKYRSIRLLCNKRV